MTTTSTIDLSQLEAPEVIKQIDFETILSEGIQDFYDRMDKLGITYVKYTESDPAYMLAEVFAYREVNVRSEANEQAKDVLLAFARNSNLDHKAAERNLERKIITEATATTAAITETDDSLRRRVQMSPEGYTTAGSEGSYIFHSLNADVRVKDALPDSPSEGICNVYILSNEDDGTAHEDLIVNVLTALNKKSVRPLTDKVNVFSASILRYKIQAELEIGEGPDANVILQSAFDELKKYTNHVHSFGNEPSLSGIYQALHRSGVNRVNLISPTANINTDIGQVAFCDGYDIYVKGRE